MGNEGDGVKIIERRIDLDRLGVSFYFSAIALGEAAPFLISYFCSFDRFELMQVNLTFFGDQAGGSHAFNLLCRR